MKKTLLGILFTTIFFTACHSPHDDDEFYETYWRGHNNYSLDSNYDQWESDFVPYNTENPTITIEGDGSSYINLRNGLNRQYLGFRSVLQTNKILNYFDLNYDYTDPSQPINVQTEVSQCPWNNTNKLLRVGLKGKPIPESELPNLNLVVVLDYSAITNIENNLNSLKNGLIELVNTLTSEDKISIVLNLDTPVVLIEGAHGGLKSTIIKHINNISTDNKYTNTLHLNQAYDIAYKYHNDEVNSKIIYCSMGILHSESYTSKENISLIENAANNGITLSTIITGPFHNAYHYPMELLSKAGKGIHFVVDNPMEYKKVFQRKTQNFVSVAKNLKIDIDFNESQVKSYRLIGYENRGQDDSNLLFSSLFSFTKNRV